MDWEFGIWKIKAGETQLIFIGIYHPPPSENTNHQDFSDKFINVIGDLRTEYKNIVIMGDFNTHVNNANDNDAMQFLESLDALG